jgi:tetratricopeptide (TPR) repeat protein
VRLTFTVGLPGESALRLLDDALERVGPADSVLRAKILGGLATILGFSGTRARAIEFAEQGLAMSRRLGDTHALVLNLHAAMYALQWPQDLDRRRAYAKEGVEVGRQLKAGQALKFLEQLWELQSHFSVQLLEAGDLAASDAEFEAWARIVEARERPFHQWIIAASGAARMLMRGDFEESEKLALQAFETGRLMLGVGNIASGVHGQQMFALDRERGRLRELEPVLRLFVQQNAGAETWRPGLAVIYAELGRTEEARAAFEHLAAADFEDLPRDSLWMGSTTYFADVCVFLQDKCRAAVLYRLLLPFDGRNVVIGYAIVCYGALSRYLGMLAATLERWDDAMRHFEDAILMNARMEAWPWLAHTQHQYATMLLSRDLSGDRDRAFSLLDAALATARRLGMRGLEERIIRALNKQS